MQLNDALSVAQKFLAHCERSESSLYEKLLSDGFSPEVAEATLSEAKDKSWVSDERYCLRYCEAQLCKGYGPNKIAEDLRDKGLSASAIVKTVASVEHATWEHAAKSALEKKFGQKYCSEPRFKLVRYLERRGFNDEYMMFLVKSYDGNFYED